MNIIKEALTKPKELTNILDEALDGKDPVLRYQSIKLISLIIGNKGFDANRIHKKVPLNRILE